MKIAGAILTAFGFLAMVNAEPTPPGADASYAVGAALGPFLFMGLGAFLLWKSGATGTVQS